MHAPRCIQGYNRKGLERPQAVTHVPGMPRPIHGPHMLKPRMKTLIATAALAVMSASATVAQAETVVVGTETGGGFLDWELSVTTLRNPVMQPGLFLLNALNATKADLSAIDPAFLMAPRVSSTQAYKRVNLETPVMSVSGDAVHNAASGYSTFSVQSLKMAGGIQITTPENPSGSAATGGTLAITDIELDFVNNRTYATLTGGNGVGKVEHVHLWDFETFDGGPNVYTIGHYQPEETRHVYGGVIQAEAMSLFTRSLGLTTEGTAAFTDIDYSMDIGYAFTLRGDASLVPEPSSYVLMGAGLAALLAGRKRTLRKSSHVG